MKMLPRITNVFFCKSRNYCLAILIIGNSNSNMYLEVQRSKDPCPAVRRIQIDAIIMY